MLRTRTTSGRWRRPSRPPGPGLRRSRPWCSATCFSPTSARTESGCSLGSGCGDCFRYGSATLGRSRPTACGEGTRRCSSAWTRAPCRGRSRGGSTTRRCSTTSHPASTPAEKTESFTRSCMRDRSCAPRCRIGAAKSWCGRGGLCIVIWRRFRRHETTLPAGTGARRRVQRRARADELVWAGDRRRELEPHRLVCRGGGSVGSHGGFAGGRRRDHRRRSRQPRARGARLRRLGGFSVDSIPLSGANARFLAVGDDSLLYVVNAGHPTRGDGKLSIVDPASRTELVVINGLGESPGAAAFHPSGRVLISSASEGILEVNTLTRSVTRGPGQGLKPGGDGVTGLAIDQGGRVYALD